MLAKSSSSLPSPTPPAPSSTSSASSSTKAAADGDAEEAEATHSSKEGPRSERAERKAGGGGYHSAVPLPSEGETAVSEEGGRGGGGGGGGPNVSRPADHISWEWSAGNALVGGEEVEPKGKVRELELELDPEPLSRRNTDSNRPRHREWTSV